MIKQRLTTLIILCFFAFLCASLSIPAKKSFASPAEDSLAQVDVTQTLTEQASTSLPNLNATPMPTITIPLFTEDWQIMVHKIDQAMQNGELSVDEAARLRFMAINSPENLPLAYLPNSEERAEMLSITDLGYRDGEGALADRMMAVFYDKELWSSETKAYIESEMARANEREGMYSAETIHPTTHFDIYYDSDPTSLARRAE